MSKGNSGLFARTEGCLEEKAERNMHSLPDFFVSGKGNAIPRVLQKWIGINRRDRMMEKAKSSEAKNAINYLYRPGSIIGDGSTASVLKFEKATGLGLGKNGNTHWEKAKGFLKYLQKLSTQPNLPKSDQKLLRYLIKKLRAAMEDFKNEL